MANTHSEEIRNPGPVQMPGGVRALFSAFAVLGSAAFVAALQIDAERAWVAFIMNHFFFMSLAVGGAFFAALQWVTGAMWSAPIRRLTESMTAYLPVALVTFLILFIPYNHAELGLVPSGITHLYLWSIPKFVHGDVLLEGKQHYLAIGAFLMRNALAIVAWGLFAFKLVGNSIAQDKNGDFKYTLKNRFLAPAFLLVFALSFTMASFDQMMSLDPHWYSTIFGVYCFAGLFYSTLAATCILTLVLREKLKGIVNVNHWHDLGKFMFAFTIFWAYIGFSQFMLIWYANLPEETGYYLKRFEHKWLYVSIFLLVGKFLTPFFVLLPMDSKRNPKILFRVAVFMLVAQWIDVMWLVQPEFFAYGPRIGLIELTVTLGFFGIFGLCVARFLGKYNIVAIGDPRLKESVFHHHQ